ncbi:CocE/NonD family hydrolase [Streptomyces longwoodensis]|uniref:CocE/NonD family hydrolase n=1 Tax=Streptomyces longwoodensis TaxID=68231 RepID=UPI003F53EE90
MTDVPDVLRRISGYITSHVLQRLLGLPSPRTRALRAPSRITVPASDGRSIEADLWAPNTAPGPLPTLLVATPYGRGPLFEALLARPYAERGFQVVLARLANTLEAGKPGFGSPQRDRDDVLAVVDWILRQSWFDGSLALTGPSYLGYVQWTVAEALPAEVKALVPQVTSSRLPRSLRGPGTIDLDSVLRWSLLFDALHRHGPLRSVLRLASARLGKGLGAIPVKEADRQAVGRQLPLFRMFVEHDGNDPFWEQWDFSERVGHVTVPVSLVAAWYDLFLADQLRDYERLRAAGRRPRLTVGPGTHLGLNTLAAGVRETLAWAGAHCGHSRSDEGAPVRLYVMGGGGWRSFAQWPPAGTVCRSWYLHEGNRLAPERPRGQERVDSFAFDPARPTPAVGGARFLRGAGRRDNQFLEGRSDVLTYTSAPLPEDLEIIGEVTADIWVQASQPETNLFVRLCDRGPAGSRNVCDALTRVRLEGTAPTNLVRSGFRLVPPPTCSGVGTGCVCRCQAELIPVSHGPADVRRYSPTLQRSGRRATRFSMTTADRRHSYCPSVRSRTTRLPPTSPPLDDHDLPAVQ